MHQFLSKATSFILTREEDLQPSIFGWQVYAPCGPRKVGPELRDGRGSMWHGSRHTWEMLRPGKDIRLGTGLPPSRLNWINLPPEPRAPRQVSGAVRDSLGKLTLHGLASSKAGRLGLNCYRRRSLRDVWRFVPKDSRRWLNRSHSHDPRQQLTHLPPHARPHPGVADGRRVLIARRALCRLRRGGIV
jgi:hypothetical protein